STDGVVGARQQCTGEAHANQAKRQRHEEYIAPAEMVDQKAAESRSKRGGKYHADPIDSHRLTTLVRRKHTEDHQHGERLGQAGCTALEDAREDEDLFIGTQAAKDRSGCENADGDQKGATLAESSNHPG